MTYHTDPRKEAAARALALIDAGFSIPTVEERRLELAVIEAAGDYTIGNYLRSRRDAVIAISEAWEDWNDYRADNVASEAMLRTYGNTDESGNTTKSEHAASDVRGPCAFAGPDNRCSKGHWGGSPGGAFCDDGLIGVPCGAFRASAEWSDGAGAYMDRDGVAITNEVAE